MRSGQLIGRLAAVVAAIAAVIALLVVLSAVRLLPQLRNPFQTTTTVRSQPPLLKSITSLSRYEAASGTFQVVVDLTEHTSFIPSFLSGSETLFIGQGTDIAYVDFSQLKSPAIRVSADRTTVSVIPGDAEQLYVPEGFGSGGGTGDGTRGGEGLMAS